MPILEVSSAADLDEILGARAGGRMLAIGEIRPSIETAGNRIAASRCNAVVTVGKPPRVVPESNPA